MSSSALAAPMTHFQIAAEPLEDGLRDFARQAHLLLVMDPREVKDYRTGGLNGDFSLEDGLARLLGDADIDAQLQADHSRIVVSPHRPPPEQPPVVVVPQTPPVKSGGAADQTTVAPAQPQSTVTVTGTQIPGGKPPGELIVIDHKTIVESGALNMAELLRSQPQIFRGGPSAMSRATDAESTSNSGLGEGINLRGLGARSALILLDGTRLAPSGSAAAFVDVLNIPLAAIDRIEIYMDGASAIYGADAVGGVVNFISLHPGAATETLFQGGGVAPGSLRNVQLAQVFGRSWSSGGMVLVAQVSDQTAFNSTDRPYLSSNQTRYGGANNNSPDSNPGTIEAGGTTYRIPPPSTAGPVVWTPNTENLTDSAQDAQAVPSQLVQSLVGNLQQKFGHGFEMQFEFLGTWRRASQKNGGVQESLTVPRGNPFLIDPSNGSGPVVVDYDFAGALHSIDTRSDVFVTASTLTLNQEVGTRFLLTMALSHTSEREHQHVRGDVNDKAVADALARTDDLALNVFGIGPPTKPATLAGIERIPDYRSLSAQDTVNLKLTGTLWSWTAGEAREAVGVETRGQRFDTAWSDGVASPTKTHFRRTLEAAFGQLDIPLVGEHNNVPGLQQLDLTLAARHERYPQLIHSTTPTLGLQLRMATHFLLLMKYSESFRAPNAGDVDTSQNANLITSWPDSTGQGGVRTVLLASGGNPDVKEERATSHVLGLGWTADAADKQASHIELTYFDDHFLNRIEAPNLSPDLLATVLDNSELQYLVARNPRQSFLNNICSSGRLSGGDHADCVAVTTVIDLRLRNIQSQDVRGLDLNARFVWHPPWGSLRWSLQGVYLLAFNTLDAPYLPQSSLLNTSGNPANLNVRSTLGTQLGGLSLDITGNLVNSYRNTDVTPQVPVSSWTTVDFHVAYTWGRDPRIEDSGAYEIGLTVQNVFNQAPPVVLNPTQLIAYDPSNATLWGRVLTLYFHKKW